LRTRKRNFICKFSLLYLFAPRKEKKFKLQEAELREKDILIQDNLIKFSTFLQQQEMRKKKDLDATEAELKVS
jgi:hypothetical protein